MLASQIKKPKIVMFSGGSGSNKITEGLLEQDIEPTIIINAYDDGKSTGDIRHKFDILGPSDIAKNIVVLSNNTIQKLLAFRLPQEEPSKIKSEFEAYLNGQLDTSLGKSLNSLMLNIDNKYQGVLKQYLEKFYEKLKDWERVHNTIYNLSDYGLRNMIYVGALFTYLNDKGEIDYHLTNACLKENLDLKGEILLNNQTSLWLVGLTEEGELLPSEAAIVDGYKGSDIDAVYLLESPLNESDISELQNLNATQRKMKLQQQAIYPETEACVIKALQEADIILIAPTTFESSLLPTLFSKGMKEAIAESSALIIDIANLTYERGYQSALDKLKQRQKYTDRWPDYLLIDENGMNSMDNRIPVDKEILSAYTNVMTDQISIDENHHDPRKVVDLVIKVWKLEPANKLVTQKKQLDLLLRRPHMFLQHQDRIIELSQNINSQVSSNSNYRVIIMGAGKGTRLQSDIPKILYPINGQANLSYLLTLLSPLDHNHCPIVITGEHNHAQIINAKGNEFTAIMAQTGGPGTSLLSVKQEILTECNDCENIIVVWGDWGGLTKTETLAQLKAIHVASDASVTMPTAWEREPYAGIVRNTDGQVHQIFTTKGKSHKPAFGEHDGSFFILNKNEFFSALERLKEDTVSGEVGILEAFPRMRKMVAVSCFDTDAARGFNTQSEAKKIGKRRSFVRKPRKLRLFDSEKMNRPLNPLHQFQLKKKLAKHTFQGVVFDIDGTITDVNGQIDSQVIARISELSQSNIAIAFITGRTMQSLSAFLIDKLPKDINKDMIMIYAENGAIAYTLSNLEKPLYCCKIPSDLANRAIRLFKEHKLLVSDIENQRDVFKVTPHKIQIWPKAVDMHRLNTLCENINTLFYEYNLPLHCTISSEDSILINYFDFAHASEISFKNKDYEHHRVASKGAALYHFCMTYDLKVDEVAKFGDMTMSNGADQPMMIGWGAFAVGGHVPASGQIFPIDTTVQKQLNILTFIPVSVDLKATLTV